MLLLSCRVLFYWMLCAMMLSCLNYASWVVFFFDSILPLSRICMIML
uniref:Uncharacterized protein n=1 Tax=Arundo donax TaxID=35708 RepID=A0A0A9AJN0_ARUDO